MRLSKWHSRWSAAGRVERQTKWSVAVTAFELARGIVQLVIVARILGRDSYGVLAPVYYVTTLLHGGCWVLSDQAITTFATRSLADGRPKEASLILWSNIKLSFVLGLVAYLGVAVLAYGAPGLIGLDREHRKLLLMFGLTAVFLANHKDFLAILRLANRYHYSFVVAIATGVAQLGALVAIWLVGGSLWLVVLITTGAAAVNGIGMLCAAVLSYRKMGLPRPPFGTSLREMPSDVAKFLRASFWQTKTGALGWHLDPILAAKLGTDAQAGLYLFVRRVTDMIDALARSVGQVLQTEYSRRWFGPAGDGGLRPLWRRSTTVLALSALMICGGIFLFRDLVTGLLGEEFSAGSTTLAYVLPGIFASLAATGVLALPAAVGKIWPSFVWQAVALIVQVGAIFLLVPHFGAANGVALSRSLFYIALAAVAVPFAIPVLRQNRRPEAANVP